MKQRNSDETDITFILLTKIPMNLTLYEHVQSEPIMVGFVNLALVASCKRKSLQRFRRNGHHLVEVFF